MDPPESESIFQLIVLPEGYSSTAAWAAANGY